MQFRSLALIVAICGMAMLPGCKNLTRQRFILFEDRITAAEAKQEDEASSYAEISGNPEASAQAAASRGDFRFIGFSWQTMAGDPYPHFVGVACSIPANLQPIVRRAVWSNYISDVPVGPQAPLLNETLAVRYNQTIVGHPAFPDADLCIRRDKLPDRDASKRPNDKPFEKLSARLAKLDDAVSAAIRNGQPLPANAASNVNRQDRFGLTSLGWAALRGSPDMVRRLIALGSDPWYGEWCNPRWINGGRNAISRQNAWLSPIGLAARAQREDIVALMIDAVPRKTCEPVEGEDYPTRGQAIALNELGMLLDETGMKQAHRRLFRNLLADMAKKDLDDSIEHWVDYAMTYKMTDILRGLPDAKLASHHAVIARMAGSGTFAELEYWAKRLNPTTGEKLHPFVRATARSCGFLNDCTAEDMKKLSWLLDRAAIFEAFDKALILENVFGENLGALDRNPARLARIVRLFHDRGYDFAGTDSQRCTPFMRSLSYGSGDECYYNDTSPVFARILLDIGVDPSRDRINGLTALDLAARRVADGPDGEAFKPIAAELLRRGLLRSNLPERACFTERDGIDTCDKRTD